MGVDAWAIYKRSFKSLLPVPRRLSSRNLGAYHIVLSLYILSHVRHIAVHIVVFIAVRPLDAVGLQASHKVRDGP